MLASHERLQQRQGKYGTPRHEYLQALVDEYQRTPQLLRKEEIVANLGNFAYDPINYAAMHQLKVVELFLELIVQDDQCNTTTSEHKGGEAKLRDERERRDDKVDSAKKASLVEFALGGISNCIADPLLQAQFIAAGGVSAVLPYILRINVERELLSPIDQRAMNTSLSALTVYYFLLDSSAFAAIASDHVLRHMRDLEGHAHVPIANIASAISSRYEELLSEA